MPDDQLCVGVQTTVHEALMFSSRLRFTNEVDNETVKEFVEEVRPPAHSCAKAGITVCLSC